MQGTEEHIRTTCPRDCYDACGVLAVKRNGALAHVRGDPTHEVSRGKLCRKCTIAYNGVFLDEQARLTRPLIRSGPKGTGAFREAPWDEALGVIADRLSQIIEASGGQAITCAHYTGTFSLLAYWFPMRLMRRLGATEVDPDTICNKAGHVALEYLYGTSLDGFDPRTIVDSACVLVWGCNPSASAPHQDEHWLRASTCTKVVVDPIRTETAKAADLHLQARPGTDAALAFGMLHLIHRDGLLAREFVDLHTVGWAELEESVLRCDPAWTERHTGVPRDLIEAAARAYGAGPSLLWIGQGLQRQTQGGNVVRSVGLLPAVTGNIGKPGAGFLYLNGFGNRRLDEEYVAGIDAYPDASEPISHMNLADHLADPSRSSALICFNINPAASNPDQRRLRDGLSREDLFTVVVDLFPTDTVDCADVVLPAASFLEFDDIVASYFHRSLSAQVKVVDPPGEALPNMEIFRRLASSLGLTDPPLHERDADILDRVMERTGTGLTFAELASEATIWPSEKAEIQFGDLRFPTPSGKVELASSVAEANGHGRTPQPTADAPPASGRLRLLSPASPWTLNASFSNEPKIHRRVGEPTVALHPTEGDRRGVESGAWVILRSDTGELRARVLFSDDVPPGTAYLPKGRWPKQEVGRANVNVLNPSRPADFGESATYHATEVILVPERT